MMRIIDSGPDKVPIRVWARRIDGETEAQLRRLAALPFLSGPVASMADAHMATGVAVGSVFVSETTLVPAALGSDLGCGVAAMPFSLPQGGLGRRELEKILAGLAARVPVGAALHSYKGVEVQDDLQSRTMSTQRLAHERDRLLTRHMGTLGGGNHFLELDRDSTGRLWVMVHSGSRGIGAAIFQPHQRAASSRGEAALHGVAADSDAGRAYWSDLSLALDFAKANRSAMLACAAEAIAEVVDGVAEPSERIDVEHNFIRLETHLDRQLFVHRKGATTARAGELSLVPGSMGTASYVVRGLGSLDSYHSCSHGAGRVMSRSKARHRVRAKDLERVMRHVVFDRQRLAQLTEEAPAAYRDIQEVIEDQRDLIEPVWRLEPLAVLKG